MKEKGVKILKARGYAKLIVHQVRGQYSVKKYKMKNYHIRVWDEIEGLDAFSIESMPRELNLKVDSLAVLASLSLPHQNLKIRSIK